MEFDPATGDLKVFDVKTVVEDVSPEELEAQKVRQAERLEALEAKKAAVAAKGGDVAVVDADFPEEKVFNPKTEIMYSDAQVMKMGSKIGDVLRMELPIPGDFGRMAAMTAKQVIMQKLREAEREIVFNEYKEQEGEILIGTVQRREGRVVLVDIGKASGVLLPQDQVRGEQYNPGDKVKVYVREVSLSNRGPQILLSRSAPELVEALFELEVPEIAEGIVEIKAIAREAGSRTKVAVYSEDDSIDPIGACIGQRGVRIQTIIHEIGGEKIDVIEWSDDPQTFILNALAPAKIDNVELNEEEKVATIAVDPDQLSLTIGKGGQNVRLASQLTGWKINIKEDGGALDQAGEETQNHDDNDEEVDEGNMEENAEHNEEFIEEEETADIIDEKNDEQAE